MSMQLPAVIVPDQAGMVNGGRDDVLLAAFFAQAQLPGRR
jgi:hypothetical protein